MPPDIVQVHCSKRSAWLTRFVFSEQNATSYDAAVHVGRNVFYQISIVFLRQYAFLSIEVNEFYSSLGEKQMDRKCIINRVKNQT